VPGSHSKRRRNPANTLSQQEAELPSELGREKAEQAREKAERLRARVEDLYQQHRILEAAYKQGQAEYQRELAKYKNQIAKYRGTTPGREELTSSRAFPGWRRKYFLHHV
jgi:hypothetical protein